MDALISFLMQWGPEHWLVVALLLLIAEMATGTTYLLWPAVAAFITALIAWTATTGWIAELSIFAVLVIVLTAFGRPLVRKWRNLGEAQNLNERGQALIGSRGVVARFADGVGAVTIGDTVWRAVSGDALTPGQQVEITGVEGVTLSVKRTA